MERIGHLLTMIDHILDTKKKRHIAGGLLLGTSLFFGTLAVTVLTLKGEDDDEERYID